MAREKIKKKKEKIRKEKRECGQIYVVGGLKSEKESFKMWSDICGGWLKSEKGSFLAK